jgi:aminoglycoside phosphotransferase (APT) family kinase protein
MITIDPATTSSRRVGPDAILAVEHVNQLLASSEIGLISGVAPVAFAGRNKSWIMTLSTGQRVFVKQILGQVAGLQAFPRSLRFASFSEQYPGHSPASPRLIASDRDSGILIFDYCPGESLALLVVEEIVPANLSHRIGALLARLHSAPTAGVVAAEHPSPPVDMITVGVPVQRYAQFTFAEIAFWKQLQADGELGQAVKLLRDSEALNRTALIHGDLRLDQFHLSDEEIYLLDWEEFGVGDPARDLGTLAGEWVYRAVLDTVTTRGGATAPPEHFDERIANARITERIASLLPRIQDMWEAYIQASPVQDSGLAVRATAHLGWHLIDRTVARASTAARLPGIERAAAGIGRKVLLDPQRYAHSLGFVGGLS